MLRISRFYYRLIHYIIIIASMSLLFLFVYYSNQLYDLEETQKNYVKRIIQLSIADPKKQSSLMLNVNDIHQQLLQIYHQRSLFLISPNTSVRLSSSSSSFQQFWTLANNFNLSFRSFEGWKNSNSFVIQIEQDFPQSFFGIVNLVV